MKSRKKLWRRIEGKLYASLDDPNYGIPNSRRSKKIHQIRAEAKCLGLAGPNFQLSYLKPLNKTKELT